MRNRHLTRALMVTLGLTSVLACSPYIGIPDAGDGGDPPPPPPPQVTAQDIGTRCEYNPAAPLNPTNDCAPNLGLTCLMTTSDLRFSPFAAGDPRNLTLGVWEDQFSVYRQDGIDEGYCTLVATFPQVPACPAGTEAKFLSPTMSVCLRSCENAAECNRLGYTCDTRYLDVGPTCVRQCGFDLPDCIRSAHVQRPDGAVTMHLFEPDLRGASTCNVGTGLCELNPGEGVSRAGEACDTSLDCADGFLCLQGGILASADPNQQLLPTGPGVCARPCKPGDPNDPNLALGQGCLGQEICQAGFTFGHGNPFDANLQDANGFLAIDDVNNLVEAGGWCFNECQTTQGDCSISVGTECGAANDVFGQPWNNISMCLPDSLRR